MSDITYKELQSGNVAVELEGLAVGIIHRLRDGFQYRPKGQTNGGDVFPTLDLCKQSLEIVDDELEQEIEAAPDTYHVRSIKLTWRDKEKPLTFDQELQAYINEEAKKSYALEQLKEFTRSRPAGMNDEVVVVVITRYNANA